MEGIDCLMHYKNLYVSARSGTEKGRDGEMKVSCVQEVMFRRCFIVFSRGIGATTNIKTVVSAPFICGRTVSDANQYTHSSCHCSATNSCQNLPRRVGGVINSTSSAGPHFTGGGPPRGGVHGHEWKASDDTFGHLGVGLSSQLSRCAL